MDDENVKQAERPIKYTFDMVVESGKVNRHTDRPTTTSVAMRVVGHVDNPFMRGVTSADLVLYGADLYSILTSGPIRLTLEMGGTE